MYFVYFIFILMVNFILYIINYKFILLLNIDYLVSIYFLLSLFSLFLGMYYIFYKFKFKFDVNKTISLTGKFCLSFFIIIYSGIFIGLKTGYLMNIFENSFI
uniref:Uncharacterized protein n=1 Tax=Lentinula edodes TaxID=5353 RepID=A0A343C5H9_LENED|nr:hypothetical protein [Lentinula edodes]QEN73908.1 hypothetical protein [Lentinula edodes]UZS77749.1 hypothetical protein [Lentinula edodes]UZS77799.1 hypothetical protein [Lentinula edodes]UZS77849.1 hypothetical protein [Lentinula edodes]